MSDTIHIENIKRRARLEGKDFPTAASEYFRDHPGYYGETTRMDKGAAEDRERVDATVQLGMERIACRDKLDLTKAADQLTAQTRLFTEDPGLAQRYKAANTVRVDKASL